VCYLQVLIPRPQTQEPSGYWEENMTLWGALWFAFFMQHKNQGQDKGVVWETRHLQIFAEKYCGKTSIGREKHR
jgi:hypothetical protein